MGAILHAGPPAIKGGVPAWGKRRARGGQAPGHGTLASSHPDPVSTGERRPHGPICLASGAMLYFARHVIKSLKVPLLMYWVAA
jgi:hypothetical protein